MFIVQPYLDAPFHTKNCMLIKLVKYRIQQVEQQCLYYFKKGEFLNYWTYVKE